MADRCSWCGVGVDPDDGYRALEREGERIATFCRLEHVVPWVIQGAHWEPGTIAEPDAVERLLVDCAQCGVSVGDHPVLLFRHRGEHRVGDGFCSADHLLAWAKKGGRWA